MGFDIILGVIIGVVLAIWLIARFRNQSRP